VRIGIQDQGLSSEPIYRLAESTIRKWGLPYTAMVLDLGGGAGHFAKILLDYFEYVHLMDFAPVNQSERIIYGSGDLNHFRRHRLFGSHRTFGKSPPFRAGDRKDIKGEWTMLDNNPESNQLIEQIVFVAKRSISALPRQLLTGAYNRASANRPAKNFHGSRARS
jgi:hypothetical protein